MTEAGTERCFVALDFPAAAKAALGRTIEVLAAHGAAVRWVRPEQLHLTLAFLGDVTTERVAAIRDALRAVAAWPFELRFHGLGSFPPHGPARVLWAGLDGDLDALTTLANGVLDALAGAGVPREARPFQAHVTIGRVKGGRGLGGLRHAVAAAAPDVRGEAMPIDCLTLYRSQLGPGGAVHEALETFALGGAGSPP